MSTRANVVISYKDHWSGADAELWLYHHYDGNVRDGVGEAVVQAIDDSGCCVDSEGMARYLMSVLPQGFEIATGVHWAIEFLYRVGYMDDKVTVVVRHGGYVGEGPEEHYDRANDTTDNSVELYSARFEGKELVRMAAVQHDIREPESYVRTLIPGMQPAARAWRGHLHQRRGLV